MTDDPATRTLLVYFSRPGENYYYGDRIDLEVGNTQVLAELIAARVAVDTYRIEAADPYPADYEATVARNVREQQADARPTIVGALPSLEDYDTVLLGSPIWNVQAPMIMRTFIESVDLTGKTIHPFVTFAVSGMGTVERDYRAWCPGSTIGAGLAVQGEKVRDSSADVDRWVAGLR
ncbi:flavodoxin [Leifsonia aquatica]|uniref:flavodoxin n=1 Tax=Leifsonia aquatica TaxID=144185 RepID=UPI003809CA7A